MSTPSKRTAIVTGGASGIGRAIVRRLAADGLNVALFDITPTEERHGLIVDLTDRAQVDKATDAVRDRYRPVSVLVNAAGKGGPTRFSKLSFEEWQRVVDINLNGVYHCESVLQYMWEDRWGRIVNISSSSAHSGQPFMAHYVAAKSAVNGLTKSLARELAPRGAAASAPFRRREALAVPPGPGSPSPSTSCSSKWIGEPVPPHACRGAGALVQLGGERRKRRWILPGW
ncbi:MULTISPECIES: SDR family NAD(P)-dependent oxidoreductase [Streptomyces]|uniref:SDR family NAD(P)-dependent oxidoreductase n=1 Tax=Streptomyces flaveolus TaxID=67297 RepID=A0ABV3APP0_9ACTN|nr:MULTISPECIES: SDR family NAD(P)-dependent oxidoreductase [Streptomyces]